MRRFQALLVTAGLAAVPSGAVAGPSHNDPWSTSQTFEKFEWSTSKGRLGVLVMSLTPELRKHLGATEDRGVLTARVEAGTPAQVAGIEVGDVIVSVRGQKVDAASDVSSAIAGVGKGQDVAVEIVRDGKPVTLHVKLTDDVPSNASMPPWLRDWMKPFDTSHHFAPLDEPSWFREWMKPFYPKASPSDEHSWLRKLREWLQPANPQTSVST